MYWIVSLTTNGEWQVLVRQDGKRHMALAGKFYGHWEKGRQWFVEKPWAQEWFKISEEEAAMILFEVAE